MNAKELKKKLDKTNKEAVRLHKRDMKAKKSFSPEFRAVYKIAIATWHEWAAELDRE